jgi:hypothetical protein
VCPFEKELSLGSWLDGFEMRIYRIFPEFGNFGIINLTFVLIFNTRLKFPNHKKDFIVVIAMP